MLRKKNQRLTLFYFLFALFILWIIIDPSIELSYKDGSLIVLFVILTHAHVDKRHLYKKLAEKYRNQSDLLNTIFMNCPDLIYRKDSNLRYVDCNPVMKKMLCIDKESNIYKKSDYDFYAKETADTIRGYDKKVMDNAGIVSYKIEKKMFNGETKIYDTLLAPIIKKKEISGILGILRDVTPVEQLKEKILIQNAQLSSIIDNIPFMIYMKDMEGRVITCNSKVERHLGIPREKILGLTPGVDFLQEFKKRINIEDEKVILTKTAQVVEVQSVAFSEKTVWYEITKSPILDFKNEVRGIIVVVKNIEKEKELEKQKETLVSTITHDLKTPTNAQLTAMGLLLGGSMGELSDEQKEIITLAQDSNIYMFNMISTILATYKSESQSIVLEPETFDFEELVKATSKELSILAYTKKQNLCVQSDALTDKNVTADKLQLKRAITNFISNAITYGFEKTDILINIQNLDESGVTFNVTNKSHYIPPEKLKDIFEKYKTKENAKFNKASTGLGLYLSREIVYKHDGEVHARSREDQTCEFGFTIPKVLKTADKDIKTIN